MGRESSGSRSFTFWRAEKESAVGCMSGILQLFDFHQLQHSQDPHQQQQPHASRTRSLQDLEAPRNSLDLEFDPALPSLAKLYLEDDVDVQIGIQVHQRLTNSTEKRSSAEISNLQGSKTPNLVARLMGLELLPDQVSSPTMHRRTFSSYLTSVQKRDTSYEMGSRSLPDTPRISAARRSDVDPRLSLQLNKENTDLPEFRHFSRSFSRDSILSTHSPYSTKKMVAREGRIHEGNRSPRVREMVKQVKTSVRRRAGTDITNIGCRNRSSSDESAKKTKRVSRTSEESKQNKQQSTPSSSPRLRHLENKEPMSNSPKGSSSRPYNLALSPFSSTSTTLESLLLKESSEKPKPKPLPKSATMCRKANCERFTQRASGNPSAKARKKCKTHISNTSLVQIHPPSNTTETQIQTVVAPPLPSASSHLQQYQEQPQKPNPPPVPLEDRAQATTPAELPYVAALLDRAFADGARCHSPSHQLDPTLFLLLEGTFRPPPDGPLHQISNRRLLFDLVDEILKPHLVKKPWLEKMKKRVAVERDKLLEQVLLRVRRSPSAKCETLQDVDGLVEIELSEANVRRGGGGCSAVDEEAEWVVFEAERLVLESLVEEALAQMTATTRSTATMFRS